MMCIYSYWFCGLYRDTMYSSVQFSIITTIYMYVIIQ